jgi:hypothetical protein
MQYDGYARMERRHQFARLGSHDGVQLKPVVLSILSGIPNVGKVSELCPHVVP